MGRFSAVLGLAAASASTLLTGLALAQRTPRGAPPPPPPPPPPLTQPVAEPPLVDPLPRWGGVAAGTAPLTLLDAVQTTLRINPTIAASRAALATQTAQVGLARAPFDPVFNASLNQNRVAAPVLPGQRTVPSETALLTDTTSLSLGANAATPWGMNVSPTVGIERVYQRAANSVVVPGIAGNATQMANVGLTVVQKLLRGAGTVGAASAVEGARRAEQAAVHTVAETAQERVFDTASAYFAWVAATKNVALLTTAADASHQMVEETRILVESNQRPRADLHQLEGNLATRTNALVAAQDDQLQAMYALRTAMGLGAERLAYWQPVDALPVPRLPPSDVASMVGEARQNRSDLKAARELVASSAALLRGADWNTLPELDLQGSIGYTGGLEKDGLANYFASLGNNVPGLNAGVGLSVDLPFNNTAARAARDLQRAQLDQARIANMDLDRRVPTDVQGALDDLRLSAAALEASSQAVQRYQEAVTDEHDKMKAGVGTVLDTLITEELLIQAELTETANHLRYATALTKLRLETGGLPSEPDAAPPAVAGLLN